MSKTIIVKEYMTFIVLNHAKTILVEIEGLVHGGEDPYVEELDVSTWLFMKKETNVALTDFLSQNQIHACEIKLIEKYKETK